MDGNGASAGSRLDKTDRLDARAIALFARQEAPDLPVVAAEDETAILSLLSLEREAALAESTRLRNQLHALLLQLDPHYEQLLPSLKAKAGLAYEAPDARPMQQVRAESVRRLALRLELALSQAEDVAAEIRSTTAEGCEPLTRICGRSLLTAGTIAGILGPGRRFRNDAARVRWRCALGSILGGTRPASVEPERQSPTECHRLPDSTHSGALLPCGSSIPG